MKIKIPSFLKNIFTGKHKKRNIWIAVILILVIIIGFFVFSPKNKNGSIQTGFVTKQNLKETVLSTGQIVSSTDLSLSFQGNGVVKNIYVKEGDKVNKGKVLASLNSASAYATLTSARGSYAQAKANYDKLVNGLSSGDIQTYQNALASAEVNLNNAYSGVSSVLNNGYTAIFNAYAVAKSVRDAYFTSSDSSWSAVFENTANINNNLDIIKNSVAQATGTSSNIDLAISRSYNSLTSVLVSLQVIRDQTNIDNYSSRVSATDKTTLDAQKTAVSSALSSVTTLQSNIASYKVAFQTAKDNLSAKQSAPRQEDVDLAAAQVLSAQGQVDAAQAVLSNLIIVAPADGTITQVDIRVGEQATPLKTVIILQDIGNLYAEADISEANIASLQIGQVIDYTLDAFGPDKHFTGNVLTINPSSTVISGVVNYLIKGSLNNIPDIKPGMTVNITILVAEKNNVLAVPSTAVINKNNKQYVRVIDDSKKKTYHEVEVKTGLRADGGLIEIISGLSEGQEVVIYMKK